MNCASRFSLLLAPLLLASSCAGKPETLRQVDESQYRHKDCWFNARGELEAFLVIGRTSTEYVPYLVSSLCHIGSTQRRPYPDIFHLNDVSIDDRSGVLGRAFPYKLVKSNYVTSLPTPAEDDPVYLIRAVTTREQRGAFDVLQFQRVLWMTNTGTTFGEFLKLDASKRHSLLKQVKVG
jgi:hypothetical protein